MNHPYHFSAREKIQIAAFKLIFGMSHGTLRERMAKAIAATSDIAWERQCQDRPRMARLLRALRAARGSSQQGAE